jgi:hypothetical protein
MRDGRHGGIAKAKAACVCKGLNRRGQGAGVEEIAMALNRAAAPSCSGAVLDVLKAAEGPLTVDLNALAATARSLMGAQETVVPASGPPTVRFCFNCGHRAALPRTAGPGQDQTSATSAKTFACVVR